MKTCAYIRISTDKQDGDNQKHTISSLYSDVCYYEECVSGKVSWKQRDLANLVNLLETGDTLVVTELSRLGRSMLEVMELLSILLQKKIHVHSIKENFKLADDIQSKVIAFAFSLAAEIERQLISQRTKEALAAKKAKGKLPVRGKDKKRRKRRKSCHAESMKEK